MTVAYAELRSKAVGSIVKLKVNGTPREFIVGHQGLPSSLYDASCNGTWLIMQDLYEEYRQWNNSNTNKYADSTVNAFLNGDFFNRLDPKVQAKIKSVKIPYTNGSAVASGANGLACKVFLLSGYEVGWTKDTVSPYYLPEDGAVLSYFMGTGVPDAKRIAYFQGAAKYWWLRSPYTFDLSKAWAVNSSGGQHDHTCINGFGIRPAMILPFDIMVSDDGTITGNTAPTMPISITVPETIQGGSAITVQWAASTDTENNLEGYELERSTDGGSSWNNIYKGNALSTTNTVPFGTESVMYRVRAYDSEDLYSGYRASSQKTVVNNTAPSTVPGITVPAVVKGGAPLSIAWDAAIDSDDDLVGYSLERQVNGGEWTEIYRGADRIYSDTITKGWETVAYRVQAYDSYDALGGYAVSETRTVDNNTPPTISGQDADRGHKVEGFSETYTVTDFEGDNVIVTEYVDNREIRSFQAVLGQENTIELTRELWLTLANGSHELRVEAADSSTAVSIRAWTFSKLEQIISFQLSAPEETDEPASKVLVSPTWHIEGATALVEACNNAFDDEPTWEDITPIIALNRAYNFTNKTKTADKWGIDIRFTITKNEGYEGEVSISGFGGAYE